MFHQVKDFGLSWGDLSAETGSSAVLLLPEAGPLDPVAALAFACNAAAGFSVLPLLPFVPGVEDFDPIAKAVRWG